MVARDPISGVQRRVTGYHDFRVDGMSDLLLRCRGASVLDVACNRGMLGFEFANNGAALVHGVDNYELGITVAREVFADLRNVSSRFEVVDLTKGPVAFEPLQYPGQYDIVLFFGIVHKLLRIMPLDAVKDIVRFLADKTRYYFGARVGEDHRDQFVNQVLVEAGLKLVHWSTISVLGPAGIWIRPGEAFESALPPPGVTLYGKGFSP